MRVALFLPYIAVGKKYFFFNFYSRGPHTKQKKMVRKPPHNRAGCIVEPYNASRHPNSNVYNVCLVKGRQRTPRACNFFLWANIASAYLPIQTYGNTLGGVSLI